MVFLCLCGGLIWENKVHICGSVRCSCGGIIFDGRGHCCGYRPDYSVPPTDYELWKGFRSSDEWIGSTNWGKRSPSLFNTKNQETSILNSASAMEDVKNIKQTGSFQDYCVSFDILLTKVLLSEDYASSLFVGGLKPEIMCWVKFLRPKTLEEAYEKAKNQANLLAIIENFKELKRDRDQILSNNEIQFDDFENRNEIQEARNDIVQETIVDEVIDEKKIGLKNEVVVDVKDSVGVKDNKDLVDGKDDVSNEDSVMPLKSEMPFDNGKDVKENNPMVILDVEKNNGTESDNENDGRNNSVHIDHSSDTLETQIQALEKFDEAAVKEEYIDHVITQLPAREKFDSDDAVINTKKSWQLGLELIVVKTFEWEPGIIKFVKGYDSALVLGIDSMDKFEWKPGIIISLRDYSCALQLVKVLVKDEFSGKTTGTSRGKLEPIGDLEFDGMCNWWGCCWQLWCECCYDSIYDLSIVHLISSIIAEANRSDSRVLSICITWEMDINLMITTICNQIENLDIVILIVTFTKGAATFLQDKAIEIGINFLGMDLQKVVRVKKRGILLAGIASHEMAALQEKVKQLSTFKLKAKLLFSSDLQEIELVVTGEEGGAEVLPLKDVIKGLYITKYGVTVGSAPERHDTSGVNGHVRGPFIGTSLVSSLCTMTVTFEGLTNTMETAIFRV